MGNKDREPRLRTKIGNQDGKPRLRTKTKNGEQRIKKTNMETKENKGLPGFRNILTG